MSETWQFVLSRSLYVAQDLQEESEWKAADIDGFKLSLCGVKLLWAQGP
jgi:hypothetical protein